MVFLATMANRKNHMLYADEDTSLEDREVELNESREFYGGPDDIIFEEVLETSSELSDDTDSEIEVASGATASTQLVSRTRMRANSRKNKKKSIEDDAVDTPSVHQRITRANSKAANNKSSATGNSIYASKNADIL